MRRFLALALLALLSLPALAQVYNPPTPGSIGGMTISGSNATDPVTFVGTQSIGGAFQIGGANALSFKTFDNGTAGDTMAIGRSALGGTAPAAAGYQNLAIGALTMSGNGITTAALANTAVGYSALAALSSGANNIALGHRALSTATTANNNVAIGASAMLSATGGSSVGVGVNAASNQTGALITAVGFQAGQFISSGSGQTAVGYNSMLGITGTRITGVNNTTIGQQAGLLLQGAAATNTLVGSLAGSSITSGGSNVILGPSVASTTLTTGSNNVLIGTTSNITTAGAATSNTIQIGAGSTAIIDTTGAGTPATSVTTVRGILDVIAGLRNNGKLIVSPTAPTIASGGCTTGSAQTISANNGTAAFQITLGGATCGSTITLTMPAAATDWVCDAHNITTPASNVLDVTGAVSTTAVVLTNYVRTTGVAGNFTGANVLRVKCTPY